MAAMACPLQEKPVPSLSYGGPLEIGAHEELDSQYQSSNFLQTLPDDVLAVISKFLCPRDVCNLSLCCKSLTGFAVSDKVWFSQCERLGALKAEDLILWRKSMASYKALCRFLLSVRPLIGMWVHQNPELGNVVYVMWGFLSLVACRVISQELGPQGFNSPLLWAPVFEIISESDGSLVFYLHGREIDQDYFYPGSLKPINKDCNVLLLEVEPRRGEIQAFDRITKGKLLQTKSSLNSNSDLSRSVSRSESKVSISQRVEIQEATESVPFGRLAFRERRKLLELVASQVRMRISSFANGPLFPGSKESFSNEEDPEASFQREILQLTERRSILVDMYKLGDSSERTPPSGTQLDGIQMDVAAKALCHTMDSKEIKFSRDRLGLDVGRSMMNLSEMSSHVLSSNNLQKTKKRSLKAYFKDGLKQIIGKGAGMAGTSGLRCRGSSSSDNKHTQLHKFLSLGTTIGLCLHASTLKLSTYRAWPIMHDNRFALYKLPEPVPCVDQEFAGLWGGTFGWPPGILAQDKPGKALFFLLISYEEAEEGRLLIATKILEGTHYVLHPNGSPMFIVKANEPSFDPFPWQTYGDSLSVEIVQAYSGEGIANGYGFRYPGSKPGTLFVTQNGLLAFVWKESNAVLTLQRLDLQSLLRKGERVPALPPIANFAYLTKSYSNVFAPGGSNNLVPLQRMEQIS
ncbi:hypothetical protein AMTRI_Chr11g100030 [Amborella trichopoda]